jgi:HTH-type transcriptional regulator/antitoxin HigA
MNIQPIHNDEDHRAALVEIERLWNAPEGSEDSDRLDVLAALVEKYEDSRWPIEQLDWDPVDASRGRRWS